MAFNFIMKTMKSEWTNEYASIVNNIPVNFTTTLYWDDNDTIFGTADIAITGDVEIQGTSVAMDFKRSEIYYRLRCFQWNGFQNPNHSGDFRQYAGSGSNHSYVTHYRNNSDYCKKVIERLLKKTARELVRFFWFLDLY